MPRLAPVTRAFVPLSRIILNSVLPHSQLAIAALNWRLNTTNSQSMRQLSIVIRQCRNPGDALRLPCERIAERLHIPATRSFRFGVRTPRCDTAICTQRSEEHTSELQSPCNLVCRLLLEKKKKIYSSKQ